MDTVNGVLGPVAAGDLGFTLMHEHILVANWAMRQSFHDWIDIEAVTERAVERVTAAKELGVQTMVDLTPINLGRDIAVMRTVAERTGMNIIASTGFYWHEEPWMTGWTPDKLADWLVRDCDDGIQGTDAKAGMIKCATDHQGLTDANKKVLHTAARVHERTGLPISTHTLASAKQGLEQQAVFKKAEVDLGRVVIGHCGDSADLDYLQEILDNGSYIGMDRFGLDQILPTKKRVSTIAQLCDKGYADRMVLSHDACSRIDWYPQDVVGVLPDWNYCHISKNVLPALQDEGVSDDDIAKMTTLNPRKILCGE